MSNLFENIRPLPSRYWEPQPDKEDEERMEREIEEGLREPVWPDEPLPFE